MRRVIEELIEQRKNRQDELKQSLEELAGAIEAIGLVGKKRPELRLTLQRLHETLAAYTTAQDKEWDAYANNHSTTVFKSLQWKIEKLEAEYSNLRTLLSHFVELENRLDRLLDSLDSTPAAVSAAGLRAVKEQLSPLQYADFEQRFRGSREQIERRLQKYLPLFAGRHEVLDIGCGRGEFLELLAGAGHKGVGIDLSDSMLEMAREKGLECHKEDALAYLQNLPAASLDGIFSSQVIEHFQPEFLRRVVSESFRTLRPGSPLLLETINPLSLFALSRIYFLDPTHRQPLHPEYMRYLLASSGFSGVEIIFTAEPENEKLREIAPDNPLALPFNDNVDRLNKLLFSACEYAVQGVK
ncbi:MAG TPA: methyltransferase domain-containing protein [Candidatus Binatia bacterium]|nr:methyltransferase domain-containing protein [Candidatus Binatia bacterium]